jgi:ABC-type glycerol-3-phosphate transport system permease component
MTRTHGSATGRIALNAALLVTTVVFGSPFLWIVVLALDRGNPGALPWPREATLDNFRTLFDSMRIATALRNSLIVVCCTTVLAVLTSALAGFGLSRIGWRRKTLAAYSLLLLYTFPLSATMVPINDLARRLDLHNTYRGLILGQTAIALPFLIWLMKGFFDAIPLSLQEAAELDGRSRFRVWLEILLPIARPGLAVVAGFAFLSAWAEVMLVIAMVSGQRMAPVSLRFMSIAHSDTDSNVIAALGVVYMIAVLLVFACLRRAMAQGIGNAGRTV